MCILQSIWAFEVQSSVIFLTFRNTYYLQGLVGTPGPPGASAQDSIRDVDFKAHMSQRQIKKAVLILEVC